MSTLWALLTVVSLVALVVGLLMQLISRTRHQGRAASGGGLLGLILFAMLFSYASEKDAQNAGFASAADMKAANEAGIKDPAEWKHKAVELAEAKRKAAEAEADKRAAEAQAEAKSKAREEAAKEAVCRDDLQCWGDKFSLRATSACRPYVERLAKNNFEWIDGFLEPKFSHFRWKDKKKGVVTYVGDRIKYQNGFGAWIIHIYECDYDPSSATAIDVRARPGRLPPS